MVGLSVVRCPLSVVRGRRSVSFGRDALAERAAAGRKSEVRSQRSEVRDQNAESRGRTSDPFSRDALAERAAGGFTLLEVLVALGLSVILLAAVYGAINLSYRLSLAGREQMEQAQLVRALFQKMEGDIRSVVFRLQEDVATESGEAAAEDEETTETEKDEQDVVVEETTAEDALTSGSDGVYGDAQALVLHVSRPARVPAVTRPEDENDPDIGGSDLAAVNYFLAVRGASGLPGMVAQMAYEGSLLNAPRTGTVSGLTRLEGDLMSVQRANETGDIATLAASARILAPEVVSLSFAYWDGIEWWESWDSVASGALPSAIEITLGVDASEKDADGVGGDSLSDRIRTTSTVNDVEPRYFRHVVALPLAEPYVGELSQ